ncbi:MAG: DUF559 domain-containing protein [Bacteroidota bacterium]
MNTKKLNITLKKYYKGWKPVTEIRRSFFIWTGSYSNSIKEKEIYKILKRHNLRFYCEISFDMIKRFDFYIPLLDLVIEYDGGQHFSSIKNINNDIGKESQLKKLGVKLIRYNKTHNLTDQIKHDLIHHPVLSGI